MLYSRAEVIQYILNVVFYSLGIAGSEQRW